MELQRSGFDMKYLSVVAKDYYRGETSPHTTQLTA